MFNAHVAPAVMGGEKTLPNWPNGLTCLPKDYGVETATSRAIDLCSGEPASAAPPIDLKTLHATLG